MYGNSMRGVRISLPDDPFEWQLLNAYHQVPGTDAKWQFDNAEAPFSLDEVFGDGYLLLPMIDRTRFLKEVCYVEDVAVEAVHHRLRPDRKSVGEGTSVSVRVDPGGSRIIKKKRHENTET